MIYKSEFGLYNFIGVWFSRIFWTAILAMAIFNFEENPGGLTIVIVLTLFIQVRLRTEYLTINENSIEIQRRILYDLLPILTTLHKDQIQDVDIQGNRYLTNSFFRNILPFGVKFKNRISFKLIGNKEKSFKTDIFMEELEKFKENFKKSRNDLYR